MGIRCTESFTIDTSEIDNFKMKVCLLMASIVATLMMPCVIRVVSLHSVVGGK